MAEVTAEEAPRKARELFEKGFAAMERGQWDYAMDMFNAALDIAPQFLRARKFLRVAQVKSKGTGNQLSHVWSTLRGLPELLSAKSSVHKKPAQSLKKAERLMRLDPMNMTFVHLLHEAAVAAGVPEAAIMTLELVKEHRPNDPNLIERLGRLYLEVNDTQKARQCFEELVRLKPKDQRAVKALKDAAALDTMKSGGWEAAGSYRDVMKDAKEAAMLEQQSKAVKASKGVDAQIEETLSKIQREPENLNYRRALADLYTRAHRYDEALKVLKDALAQTGGADPEIDRAISSITVKKCDREIAGLRNDGDESAGREKEKEKAQFVFNNAKERVRRYPNDLQFKYDLGVLLYERGELNEAIQQFQAAQRNPQRRVRSLYYMALCFKSKKQYDIATEQLEKAASELKMMDDTKKDILYELGQIAEATGDTERAVGYYKQIYAVDIGYKDIAAKIEQGYSA